MVVSIGNIRVGVKLTMAVAALAMTAAAPFAIDLSANNGPASLQAAVTMHGTGGESDGLQLL